MLVLLVGAEVPLADDADFVAVDVDELELDLLDVWLVVDVPELVVVMLLLVEEEVDEEVEEVELDVLDVVVVEADGEALADPTEPEP